MTAPIAIFAHRRPERLAALLASLRRADPENAAPVTVFVDGPRTEAERPAVESVLALLAACDHPRLEIVASPTNLGLACAIHAGVSTLLARHDRVIVLEDDLELSPAALAYFNAALERYRHEPRIWSIAGYLYDVPALRSRSEAFFLPYAHPWGWATWGRAWSGFDPQAPLPEALLTGPDFAKAFSANNIADYAGMLDLARRGLVESWFVRWYLTIFMAGGLSLFPPRSYVRNLGIGGDRATHGTRLNPYRFLVPPAELAQAPCALPARIETDFEAFDAVAAAWDTRVQRNIIRFGRQRRLLQQALRRLLQTPRQAPQ